MVRPQIPSRLKKQPHNLNDNWSTSQLAPTSMVHLQIRRIHPPSPPTSGHILGEQGAEVGILHGVLKLQFANETVPKPGNRLLFPSTGPTSWASAGFAGFARQKNSDIIRFQAQVPMPIPLNVKEGVPRQKAPNLVAYNKGMAKLDVSHIFADPLSSGWCWFRCTPSRRGS